MFENIDSLVNFDGEILEVFTDTESSQYIEDCDSYITDEAGRIIRSGTYEQVVNYAYCKGYRF